MYIAFGVTIKKENYLTVWFFHFQHSTPPLTSFENVVLIVLLADGSFHVMLAGDTADTGL